WLLSVFDRSPLPTFRDLEEHLVRPLIDQVRLDAGDSIASLVEERLGLAGDTRSVRQTARSMGLTRARIYQLLADVGDIIAVRWPEGQYLVAHLVERLQSERSNDPELDHFLTAVDLFFPDRRNAAAANGSSDGSSANNGGSVPSQRRAG